MDSVTMRFRVAAQKVQKIQKLARQLVNEVKTAEDRSAGEGSPTFAAFAYPCLCLCLGLGSIPARSTGICQGNAHRMGVSGAGWVTRVFQTSGSGSR